MGILFVGINTDPHSQLTAPFITALSSQENKEKRKRILKNKVNENSLFLTKIFNISSFVRC